MFSLNTFGCSFFGEINVFEHLGENVVNGNFSNFIELFLPNYGGLLS